MDKNSKQESEKYRIPAEMENEELRRQNEYLRQIPKMQVEAQERAVREMHDKMAEMQEEPNTTVLRKTDRTNQ